MPCQARGCTFYGPFLPTIKNETLYLIRLNFLEPLLSKLWAFVKLWCVCLPCRAQRWRTIIFNGLFPPTFWIKRNNFVFFFYFLRYIEEIILSNWRIFFLVPNCLFHYFGAKLSWCQIVLVPNCPLPNCPVPNCPTTEGMQHSPQKSLATFWDSL